jgi:hypothetical protein
MTFVSAVEAAAAMPTDSSKLKDTMRQYLRNIHREVDRALRVKALLASRASMVASGALTVKGSREEKQETGKFDFFPREFC